MSKTWSWGKGITETPFCVVLGVIEHCPRVGPITSWEINGETVSDFIFGGSKITADGDCSHEIKRHLLLGRKVMTNLVSTGLPSKRCPGIGFSSSADREIGFFQHVAPPTRLRLEFPSVYCLNCLVKHLAHIIP